MSEDGIVLLSDEAPIAELEELQTADRRGHERGYLTFDQIAACLEETEVTKEQVQELHAYLDEPGSTSSRRTGGSPSPRGDASRRAAVDAAAPQPDAARRPKKVEVDLTVEPSLDSLRLYLRSIGRVDLLTAEQEVRWRGGSSAATCSPSSR